MATLSSKFRASESTPASDFCITHRTIWLAVAQHWRRQGSPEAPSRTVVPAAHASARRAAAVAPAVLGAVHRGACHAQPSHPVLMQRSGFSTPAAPTAGSVSPGVLRLDYLVSETSSRRGCSSTGCAHNQPVLRMGLATLLSHQPPSGLTAWMPRRLPRRLPLSRRRRPNHPRPRQGQAHPLHQLLLGCFAKPLHRPSPARALGRGYTFCLCTGNQIVQSSVGASTRAGAGAASSPGTA